MSRHSLSRTVLLYIALTALTTGCERTTRDTRGADEQAIRAADADLFEAIQAKDLNRVMSFYADDASLFPVAEPIATGKEATRENWAHTLGIPGFNTHWQMTRLQVSRSGDLVYAQGTYQTTMEDTGGRSFVEVGKWVTVYKKQPDRSWKVIADIGNTDSPPPIHKPPHRVE